MSLRPRISTLQGGRAPYRHLFIKSKILFAESKQTKISTQERTKGRHGAPQAWRKTKETTQTLSLSQLEEGAGHKFFQ